MKSTKSSETDNAFKKIVKREYLNLPEISLKTDGGSEFKGDFNKFLIKEKIAHITAYPGRHSQMAPVESLNKTLGRIFNGIMNTQEIKTGKTNREWNVNLNKIREELNDFRERDLDEIEKEQEDAFFDPSESKKTSKFKEGDIVYYALTEPRTIIGHKVGDKSKFRVGDRTFSFEKKSIVDILYYPDKPFYRYKLKTMPHISFIENELLLAKELPDDYIGMKIKKKFNKTIYNGKVKSFDKKNRWFKIKYDDGDEEELDLKELKELLYNNS